MSDKDTIYRQDAINAHCELCVDRDKCNGDDICPDVEVFQLLPSAQPEPKRGRWIWITGDVYKCSECETETHVDECFGEPIYNYCPYCNAFMDGYER